MVPSILLLIECLWKLIVRHSGSSPGLAQLYFLRSVVLGGSVLLVAVGLCFKVEIGETVEYFLGFDDCCVGSVLGSLCMGWFCIFHVICFNFLIF
jgi:hypothetical protein